MLIGDQKHCNLLNPMALKNNHISWLPKYTKKEFQIFLSVVPCLVILLNIALFGKRYFTDIKVFTVSTLVVFVLMSGLWQILTLVAMSTRSHFTKDKDTVKRLALTIFFIALICALSSTILFGTYDYFHFLGYEFNETRYRWTIGIGVIINIFVTFLHVGVDTFDNWKATLVETEQLKKEYMQSQLLGLKSQVNPHFLFNSLNSLSSLINENQEKAEIFLDEMSKVYRYLLRNSDDQLVTLETELQFINSYSYLLKSRYVDGIEISMKINEEDKQQMLPPLTLQVLVEYAHNANMISRDNPLNIRISSLENGWLEIRNNVQKKVVEEEADNSGIENISNKFRLLCQQSVIIDEKDGQKIIQIPLIPQSEMSIA